MNRKTQQQMWVQKHQLRQKLKNRAKRTKAQQKQDKEQKESPQVPTSRRSPKKERALVQEKQRIAAEKAALEAERQAIAKEKAEYEQWKALKQKAKLKPMDWLKEGGLSYEDLTNSILNGNQPDPDEILSQVDLKLQAMQKAQEEREQKKLEEEKARLEQEQAQIIEDYKQSVRDFLKTNQEKYELVSLYDASEIVVTTIEEHFNSTGKIMSNDEAAQLVEEYLEKEFERATKESKKIKTKLGLSQEAEDKKGQTEAQGSKTLTNSLVSSSAPSLLPAKTEQDRLKRALAALG